MDVRPEPEEPFFRSFIPITGSPLLGAFPQGLHADADKRHARNDLTRSCYRQVMTDDDMDRLDAERTWLGPTLQQAFDLLKALPRMPDCAICPSAQWYVLEVPPDKTPTNAPAAEPEQHLECFCTAFRAVMFKPGMRAVTACDARIDAIAEAAPTTASPAR